MKQMRARKGCGANSNSVILKSNAFFWVVQERQKSSVAGSKKKSFGA